MARQQIELCSAFKVNNVYFSYQKSKSWILEGINLDIKQGQILALLGPNGCGKTSLLRLILGRLRPNSGTIRWSFGDTADPLDCPTRIPAHLVGYMPQENALYFEFTIKEMLTYFGFICHMSDMDQINEQIIRLTKLLNLPETHRKVSQLSSGQQRLVSMAAAMIHCPKLLILDEPTVGVDPIIRSRVWQYLSDVSREKGQTVIITTHYIEEAKTADTLCFIYSAKILRHSNPWQLIKEFNSNSLEDVYYKLVINANHSAEDTYQTNQRPNKLIKECRLVSKSDFEFTFQRIYALMWKCMRRIKRNSLELIGYHLLVCMTLSILHLVIGHKPRALPIAIYNGQLTNSSIDFINYIDTNQLAIELFPSKEFAVASVVRGHNLMAIDIPHHFVNTLRQLIDNPHHLLTNSTSDVHINISIDATNILMTIMTCFYLLVDFVNFLRQYLMNELGHNPAVYSMPLSVEFLNEHQALDYTLGRDFLLAPVLMQTQHIFTMILSGFLLLQEKNKSTLDRDLVAGVKPLEILLVYTFWLSINAIIQTAITMTAVFAVFGLPLAGNLLLLFSLLMTQAFHGICCGIFLTLISDNNYISLAMKIAVNLGLHTAISGTVWPIESLPILLYGLSLCSQQTLPLRALRSIIFGGSSLISNDVLLAFAVNFVYILIFSVLDVILFIRL